MSAWYIYSAPVSGAKGYSQKDTVQQITNN